jgi:hypothetical protein
MVARDLNTIWAVAEPLKFHLSVIESQSADNEPFSPILYSRKSFLRARQNCASPTNSGALDSSIVPAMAL